MPLSDAEMDSMFAKPAASSGPISDAEMDSMHGAPNKTGAVESYSDNAANAFVGGYAPQLTGFVTKLLAPSRSEITKDIRPDIVAKPDKRQVDYDPYLIGRDLAAQHLSDEQSEHPNASLAGGLSGALAQAVLTPMPKALMPSGIAGAATKGAIAKSVLEGAAKGAIVGAGYGVLSNPGDVEGVYDPTQLDARKENAIRGAEVGGAVGGVTQAVSGGLKYMSQTPNSLKEAANAQAVKASGAMLKDFRALEGGDRTQAVGQFALDKGLVKAGDTFESVGEKADALKQNAGKRLDALYQKAGAAAEEAGDVPSSVGFNPVRDKSVILSAVKKRLGVQVGAKSALGTVEGYLDELGSQYGDNVIDPKTANNIESAVRSKVNFLRNPLTASPEGEQAFKALGNFVSDRVDNHIAYLAEKMNDPSAAEKLAEANRDYGFAKTIGDMAKDKANRILANNKFGLGDKIAGGAGGVAGAVVGGSLSGEHSGEGAGLGTVAGMVGMGMLHHYGQEYGDAMLASGLSRAAQAASIPGRGAAMAARVMTPQAVGAITRAAVQSATAGGQMPQMPGLQPGQAPAAPAPVSEQPQPMPTPVPQRNPAGAQPMPSPQGSAAPLSPQTPSKGPAKWAQDGYQNLKLHATEDQKAMLEKYKSAMLVDPKAKNLLIAAASFPPGSKPLDDVMKHLQKRLGDK